MKKTLSIMLAAVLLLSCLPLGALAEGVTIIGGGNSGNETTFGGEQELKPGEKIKVDGEYTITFSRCYCFADAVIYNGKYLGLLSSKENGASVGRYDFPIGTHTPGCLTVVMTNRSKQAVNWLKKIKCTLVFDEVYEFETLATQLNPDQTSSDKNINVHSSTDAVDIEPLVSVNINFFFAVPYIVRDSSKPLIAYISVGNDVYAVNLRQNLEVITDW